MARTGRSTNVQKDAVKEFDLPLDVAIEYSEAKKVLSQIHTSAL